MLSKEGLILLRHYIQEGLSKSAVSRKLGISRRTVHRYLMAGDQEPSYGPRSKRPSKLDPFETYLRGRLEDYPELSRVRLLAEIRDLGYQGGYTVLKDRLRALRPKPPRPIEQRFEVEPGGQAQVDFATFKTSFGTVYALLMVLSWSGALWVRFVMHQDQLTLLGGLHQGFVSFGGAPRTVLFDRMRTAVAGSGSEIPAVFNAEMLRFASHYGFSPRACRPYRAKTKGRVERAVSYSGAGPGRCGGRRTRRASGRRSARRPRCAGWLQPRSCSRRSLPPGPAFGGGLTGVCINIMDLDVTWLSGINSVLNR